MLVMCVMPAAVMQLRSRMKNRRRKAVISLGMTVFAAGMVLGRVVSGVHWFTDIVGGGLLSGGLVLLYRAAAGQETQPGFLLS